MARFLGRVGISAADLGGFAQDGDERGDRLARVRAGRRDGQVLAAGGAEAHDAEHAFGVGAVAARGDLDGGGGLRSRCW